MFFVFLSILISWLSTESVNVLSTHAVIGNYSELNPKECGITRLTEGYDEMCFEWNKNQINSLMDARDAKVNEAPWVVQVQVVSNEGEPEGYCSGSIIAEEWILTAGHCLIAGNDSKRYNIIIRYHSVNKTGFQTYSAKSLEIHQHPNFSSFNLSIPIYDLALIKISMKEIKANISALKGENAANELRSICLPESRITNTKEKYVLTAGWGGPGFFIDLPLQIGYKVIHPDPYPNFPPFNCKDNVCDPPMNMPKLNLTGSILGTSIDEQTRHCTGDSGNSAWQYHMGRAVILGVSSGGYLEIFLLNVYCETFDESAEWFTRVSLHIDWIKNVTQIK